MKPSTSTIQRTENVQRFFKDINNARYNPLEDSIIRQMFADRETFRDLIINANLRLVVNIAKEYDHSDKMMDFYQEGIEGLMIAFEKYDPTAESKFSSYASYWVRAKMSMLCREFNMVQRSNQAKIGSKAKKFQEKFLQENMREATEEEIVDFLSANCNIDVLYAGEVFDVKMGSINAELDDDGMTPESCGEFAVRTASDNDFNAQMEKEELEVSVSKMMKVLNDKERDFITRHIVNEESYYAIAEAEGYTVERVRQIVTGGLKKMRNCEFAKKQFASFLK